MRFCIITPFFPSRTKSGGGVGMHYYDLTRYLAPYCEEILLLYVSAEALDQETRESLPANVKVHHLNDRFGSIKGDPYSLPTKIIKRLSRLTLNFRVALRIMKLDKEKPIDVLETTNYLYLCLSYTFFANRKPLITRFSSSTGQLRQYGNWRSSKIGLIELLEIWMFKRSDVKLSHTHQHSHLVANQINISPSKIKIISHGTSLLKRQPKEAKRSSEGTLTILFLGRLESRKGIHTFLKAIPRLRNEHPHLQFRIAGEDPDNAYQNSFIKNNPSDAGNVTFLGEITHDQKVEEYMNCDIFAAPSLYESFGLIYIEAMSFGKPVIGCRAGGTIEVIKDKEVGYLIEPGSVDELSESISRLVTHPELRIQMGEAAQRRVKALFTADIMAEKSYRMLESITRDWNFRL